MTQKWYQSKLTIAALLALFYFIVKTWIGFEIPDWDKFVTLLLTVLAGIGVLNNGTNPSGFGANQPEE